MGHSNEKYSDQVNTRVKTLHIQNGKKQMHNAIQQEPNGDTQSR